MARLLCACAPNHRGEHGSGELILDIDYILEWLQTDGKYRFSVAPAELRFQQTTDLRVAFDYAATSAALTPFTIHQVEREPPSEAGRASRWVLKLNWPNGELSFFALGFTQVLTGEPAVSTSQALDSRRRTAFIASRTLRAFHTSRGAFDINVRIGSPYQVSSEEWACRVCLDGLHTRLSDTHGVDAFQALMLAQNLARTLLAGFVDQGGQLFDSDAGAKLDLQKLFTSGIL